MSESGDERRARLAVVDAERRAEQGQCEHPLNARVDLKWGKRCRLCGKVNP